MAMIVHAPNRASAAAKASIFLAGSIEMGTAEEWQKKAITALEDEDVVIYNPRRPDWDSSWKQSKDNPKFREQVEWELHYLGLSDFVLFYFQPGTQSPITLLELGSAGSDFFPTVVVVCAEGFWRKGNVDIFCETRQIPVYETLEEAVIHIKKELNYESTTIN